MGSKKHKKHKSERREKYEDRHFNLERPPSLKLILKVSGNSGSEHGSDSPAYGFGTQPDNIDFSSDYPEKHKKSKKKKKKKDREKRHKHHKEKRNKHRDDSSQEDMSIGEDSSQLQESILRYVGMTTTHSLANSPVTKPMIPLKSPTPEPTTEPEPEPVDPEPTEPIFQPQIDTILQERSPNTSLKSSSDYLKSPASDSSGREPRTCVLKLKQSKSPLSKLLDHLLRGLEKKDPHQFFAWPVTDDIAPGYSSIISDPMDFLSIRQKVDENEYTTMQEFIDDFKLMCDNAIRYNHVETVYHKAAKRLLHVGLKLLQPDQLIRSLRPLMMYMRELSPKELGFDLLTETEQHDNDSHIGDSADEGMSTGAEEINLVHNEEDEKRKIIRLENNPKSRFEAYVDDLTAEEVLAQAQNAAKTARKRLANRPNPAKMGFLRQNKDGTTSMRIIIDTENANANPERVVSLGSFTGKLQQGTGQLQGFREDRRNNAKIVKPINYGQFCSFAPVFDSRFSNLSKEESELVLSTYGDETGTEYAGSIMSFSKDSCYASTLANGLLDILTYGEHRKTIAKITENQRQRHEQHEIEQSFPSPPPAEDESKKFANISVDFQSLRTLTDIGVDTTFLNELEQNIRTIELHKKLQEQLLNNSTLIERLQQVQTERLSQPLPAHLSHVAHPNSDEIQLAVQITSNLTEMAKQLPPESITTPHALRKAMGISNVGLEPIVPPQQRISLGNILLANQSKMATDTTSVPMDIETDGTTTQPQPTPSGTVPVDLENELREFLEGGSTGLAPADDVAIEHMLMD